MSGILSSLADESVLLLGLVTAVMGAIGAGETTTKVVLAAVPLILALLVRRTVSSPSTVLNVAQQAACQTAANLTDKTVGGAGEVTDAATNIVGGVVGSVVKSIGGLVPRLTGQTEGGQF